jgi:hypothetical protein
MICPKCHADYLDHIRECGDCKVVLVDACAIDLPIPDMTWESLEPFQGKIYADMAAEILDNHDIPYYLKMDWMASAFNIEGANITGETIRIFVPESFLNKASNLIENLTKNIL